MPDDDIDPGFSVPDTTERPDGLIPSPETFMPDAAFWMKAAQAVVRRECGWHVAPSWTHMLTLDTYGGRTLVLPSLHVTAIGSFYYDDAEHVEDIDWSPHGTVQLRHGCLPDRPGGVRVILTDGWEPSDVPDVQAVLLAVARRAATAPAGIASQSVNGSSVSYLTNAGSPLGLPLFESERRALARYRLTWGVRVA